MTKFIQKTAFVSRAFLLGVMLLFGFATKAQISMPSTYKHTMKVFGNSECSEVTYYFIFKSASNVIWCIESYDGYIVPVAIGDYNAAKRKLKFTKGYSTFSGFYNGDIIFDVTYSNGRLFIAPERDDLDPYFGVTEKIQLNKCEYDLNPSNKLIGSSWKTEESEIKVNMYFKTDTKVLLDGEPRVYILLGNAIGIFSGDNPAKEVHVGKLNGQSMELHRSGVRKRDYPWFKLERMD